MKVVASGKFEGSRKYLRNSNSGEDKVVKLIKRILKRKNKK